ncbi:MAG: YihY/virulence factor BrkB family protein [Lachnospiraceae bacterium]|nr:YihY/virulence factor BrkB family protein [Lachnospiraceae bacterium]
MLLSCIHLIRAFTIKLREDSVSAFAAQAAFFIILSVFPFLMFLLTLLNYLPFSIGDIYVITDQLFPEAVTAMLENVIRELSLNSSGAVLSVTVIAALWSASRGMLALSRGLNAVYRYKETRNYFVLRITAAFYTLIFTLLLIATLILLVFGNQLYHFIITKVPLLEDLAFIIMSLRSLVTMAVLTVTFLLMYLFIPNRKSGLLAELPGAILTAGGWLGFSYLFSFYIDHMGNFSYLYGSLTALAVCMLWLYFCMYILFIGAEVNMILAHPEIRQATSTLFASHKKK